MQLLFQDLTRNDPTLPAEFRGFLSATFDMKMTADYEVEPAKSISKAQAEVAVALARRFVAHFAQVLGT